MAIAIRLKRTGRKKNPFYRMVVADERNPARGKAVDDLGYYDPMKDPIQIQINEEKALMWLKKGAKPTDTARSLLSKAGILRRLHAETHSLDTAEGDTQTAEQPQESIEDEAQTEEQSDSEQEEP